MRQTAVSAEGCGNEFFQRELGTSKLFDYFLSAKCVVETGAQRVAELDGLFAVAQPAHKAGDGPCTPVPFGVGWAGMKIRENDRCAGLEDAAASSKKGHATGLARYVVIEAAPDQQAIQRVSALIVLPQAQAQAGQTVHLQAAVG